MQSCNPGAIEEHTAGEYRTRTRQDKTRQWLDYRKMGHYFISHCKLFD